MRKPHRIGSPREIHQIHELWHLGMVATDPHYLNEFMRRESSRDMMDLGVFPRGTLAKEISEAAALREAAIRHLGCDPTDPNVVAICPGDGHTPRLAALIAFTTKWHAVSVDPGLTKWIAKYPEGAHTPGPNGGPVERLTIIPNKCEDVARTIAIGNGRKPIVLACHSHALLSDALNMIITLRARDSIGVAAMKCCVKQEIEGRPHDLEYIDDGVFSPARIVKIWKGRWDDPHAEPDPELPALAVAGTALDPPEQT